MQVSPQDFWVFWGETGQLSHLRLFRINVWSDYIWYYQILYPTLTHVIKCFIHWGQEQNSLFVWNKSIKRGKEDKRDRAAGAEASQIWGQSSNRCRLKLEFCHITATVNLTWEEADTLGPADQTEANSNWAFSPKQNWKKFTLNKISLTMIRFYTSILWNISLAINSLFHPHPSVVLACWMDVSNPDLIKVEGALSQVILPNSS